ncbi:MAG TPA: translation elongation factor Ts [Candidatus Paceibacterota bacterium]|nr:translation elongation factor Ts [Candidatus Paceibacterota bacterium]
MISIEQVKELRDKTGISIMQCRKALEDAGGDMEKAIVMLRKKGAEIAEKKSDRALGAGIIGSYVHSTGTTGAMLELWCETDFVSKNEDFKTLARDIAMQVVASNPEFVDSAQIPADAREKAKEVFQKEVEGKPENMKEQILSGKIEAYFKDKVLMDQPFIKNPDLTVTQMLQNATQKFGEKVQIGRFVRFTTIQ